MKLPSSVVRLIEEWQKLPSIGPRTAERLTYFLLRAPQGLSDGLSQALSNLKRQTVICETCFNIAEKTPCEICSDARRDRQKICVVEEPLDVLAIEKTGKFNGLYHVLGGNLNPVAGIGPEELRIGELLVRIKNFRASHSTERGGSLLAKNFPSPLLYPRRTPIASTALELILATNPTLEGEATAMYIRSKIKDQKSKIKDVKIRITRIARGLPTGGDLEYADEVTVRRALEGRLEY